MTYMEQKQYIGKTGTVAYDGMEFWVQVIDVRQVWGDTQVLLVPVWGGAWKSTASNADASHGAAWKSTASVRFTD